MKMKKIILMPIAILIFVGAILFTAFYLNTAQKKDATELGFITEGYVVNNILPMIYNGIAILIGIFFGFFYNRFTELQKKGVPAVNIKTELKAIFSSTNFYLALAASPIVFGIVVLASKGVSMGPALFLAFQNGFFWQNVMPKNNMPVNPAGSH